ncbi:beta-mannanase [Paenibacillus sp. LHD-38]|uniref:beta-mannanase n=1 Tax=Paenibacillus sp. LHD-38 TaxID=3072143 RepID=UPI0028104E62|nr:beta-mannanase [Paenibacillus sp. LHD-38]MDQ8737200.1 beta-mannanase [Paenibacillus sp. LHD-38]
MRFTDAEDGSPAISGLTRMIEEDRCTLRWIWPSGIEAVYISRAAADKSAAGNRNSDQLKLYTKAEYKANNGYHSRIEGVGIFVYTVYACQESGAGPQLIVQPNRENSIEISAGRAKIQYSISNKSGFFSKFKTVQIQVTAEVPIAKDVLCYVKKQGSYPANKEDGMLYPFVAPFEAGKNILPAIEIGKQDFIRLFFTDGRTYGQLYELISV